MEESKLCGCALCTMNCEADREFCKICESSCRRNADSEVQLEETSNEEHCDQDDALRRSRDSSVLEEPQISSMNHESGSELCKNCDASCLGNEDSAAVPEGEVSDAVVSGEGEADNGGSILKFHSIHGKNIKLEKDGRRVVRTNCCENGIVFGNRHISIDELVGIRLTSICTSRDGELRFGVTSVDPASLTSEELPQTHGVSESALALRRWTESLPKQYVKQGDLVQFSVTSYGDVIYSINGEGKGVFLSGVDTSRPLWVIADLVGTAKAIEFEADSPRSAQPEVQSTPSIERQLETSGEAVGVVVNPSVKSVSKVNRLWSFVRSRFIVPCCCCCKAEE